MIYLHSFLTQSYICWHYFNSPLYFNRSGHILHGDVSHICCRMASYVIHPIIKCRFQTFTNDAKESILSQYEESIHSRETPQMWHVWSSVWTLMHLSSNNTSTHSHWQRDSSNATFVYYALLEVEVWTRIRKHTLLKTPSNVTRVDYILLKSTSLKGHMCIHTGEKPFKYDFCGLGFAGNNNVKGHLRTRTGEKPLKCDVWNMLCSW